VTDGPIDPPTAPVSDDGLDEALDRVFAAAQAHLAVVRSGAAEDAVERTYRELNEASAAYDELMFDTYDEVTPWQADHLVDDDALDRELTGDGMTIAVRQRRDYLVPDVAALLTAGTQARREQGALADVDVDGLDPHTPVEDVGAAVYELFQKAGGSLTGLDVPELEARNGVLMVNAVAVPLDFTDDPGTGEADLPFVVVPDHAMLLRIDEEMVDGDGDDESDNDEGGDGRAGDGT